MNPLPDEDDDDCQTDDTEDLLLICLMRRNRRYIHSRYAKTYYRALSAIERRRRRRTIPRTCLPNIEDSSWRTLYAASDDSALITLTGLDHEAFNHLNEKFQSLFDQFSPYASNGSIVKLSEGTVRRGRRRCMDSKDCLGLVLAWTRTRGSMFVLQMIFGMGSSVVSLYIRFGRRLLIQVLKSDRHARVQIPSEEKIAQYKAAVKQLHPTLDGVWLTMDGLKLYLQQSPDSVVQNRYYNGWTHDHYVTNVLGFAPDGTIPVCCTNVPGCIHDSTVAEWGDIYSKLENVYIQNGGKVTVDSAFSKKKYDFLIKSSQNLPGTAEEIVVNEEATSMRQSAEWGMHAFQASFPRIKDRLIYEEVGERRLILKMLVLLYNYRANTVGINQIRNHYMPNLQSSGNIYQY